MISKSILVPSCTFKSQSPIVGNFDYEFILPFLRIAQDIDISERTGERLLKYIEQGVVDSTLSADDVILLEEYIQPTAIHFAMSRAYTNLLFKPDNSGIVRRNSENGASAEMSEAAFLQDQEKTVAESYGRRLVDYLNANEAKYAAYRTETDGEIKPADTPSFTGGLFLGTTNECNNK